MNETNKKNLNKNVVMVENITERYKRERERLTNRQKLISRVAISHLTLNLAGPTFCRSVLLSLLTNSIRKHNRLHIYSTALHIHLVK